MRIFILALLALSVVNASNKSKQPKSDDMEVMKALKQNSMATAMREVNEAASPKPRSGKPPPSQDSPVPEFKSGKTLKLVYPGTEVDRSLGGQKFGTAASLKWSDGTNYGDAYYESHKHQGTFVMILPPGSTPTPSVRVFSMLHFPNNYIMGSVYSVTIDEGVSCTFPSKTRMVCDGMPKMSSGRPAVFEIEMKENKFFSKEKELATLASDVLTISSDLEIEGNASGRRFVLIAIVNLWFRQKAT